MHSMWKCLNGSISHLLLREKSRWGLEMQHISHDIVYNDGIDNSEYAAMD